MSKTVPKWARPRRREGRGITSSPDFRIRNALAYPTLAGPAINEHTALSIVAVYNAVSLISNAIACLDAGVAERTEGGGRRPAVELPLFDVLARKPNKRNTAFQFRRANMVHALTSGNGYSEIEFKGQRPIGLHLLEPRNVEPRILDSSELVYHLVREKVDLPAWKVIHTANVGWDGIRGYSPITLARETLGLAQAEREYQSALMGNSAQPNGFLEVPHNLKENDKNRLRSDFEAMHRGTEAAGTIGILSGGMKWVQTSFSPADAEVLLSRAFSVAEVARLFNIPQHLVGLLDHATFSNIEQQLMEFYTFTLLPWLTNLEQEMDTKFFDRAERQIYFVYHDIKTLLRADSATLTAQDSADFGMGVKSINEIRAGRGLNPIDDEAANHHFVQVNNLKAIEDMGKPKGDESAAIGTATPADAAGVVEDVQGTALNGAQIASLLSIAQEVAAGALPMESAKGMIAASFPSLSSTQIDAILDSLKGFVPTVETPVPTDVERALGLAVDYAIQDLSGEAA